MLGFFPLFKLKFSKVKGSKVIRQKVMVLYLKSSALDTGVVAWAFYDGSGETSPMSGDQGEPPYKTGVHALRDGWRLIQASPLVPQETGAEHRTSYLKYEFFFEKLVECD